MGKQEMRPQTNCRYDRIIFAFGLAIAFGGTLSLYSATTAIVAGLTVALINVKCLWAKP